MNELEMGVYSIVVVLEKEDLVIDCKEGNAFRPIETTFQ